MFSSKNILWITFAFCVTAGSCAVFLSKIGDEVKMDCGVMDRNQDITWNLDSRLFIGKNKHGSLRKGNLPVDRARMEGNSLKISQVMNVDAGVYTCGLSTHVLYIASAHVSPSTVLYSSETNLTCDVTKGFKGELHWYDPHSKLCPQRKHVTVKAVTQENAGRWTCQIKHEQADNTIKLNVDVTVVGPLKTSDEVTVYDGGTAELPCFLPAPSSLPITGVSWRLDHPSDGLFPAISMKTPSSLQWNSTNINRDKVIYSDENLNTDFNVTVKKVTHANAGVYVCSLKFEGEKYLNAMVKLKVLKRDGNVSVSGVKENSFWYTRVWGMHMWIWIALAISFSVLIILVIIIVPIYCRNKRMKRKINRLKSMQQSLASRNYCKCGRTVRTVKQPGTGKRERPPPLPRHQYSSLKQ